MTRNSSDCRATNGRGRGCFDEDGSRACGGEAVFVGSCVTRRENRSRNLHELVVMSNR
jgi:hypothetical protein